MLKAKFQRTAFMVTTLGFAYVSTGCSGPETALKLAPTLTKNWIEDKFNLSGSKEDRADRIVDQTFANFKIKDSARLREFFQKTSQEFLELEGKDQNFLKVFFSRKQNEFLGVMMHMRPLLTDAVRELSDIIDAEEWSEFNSNFNKSTKKQSEKKPEAKVPRALEHFLGSVTTVQKEMILAKIRPTAETSLRLRMKNRNFTMTELNRRIGTPFSKEKLKQALVEWSLDFDKFQDPEFKDFRKTRFEQFQDLMVELYPTLSPKQKVHVADKMTAWAIAL